MINLLWSAVVMMLLLSGCGWNGTPTRNNDFIPLTSIEISAESSTIALSKTIAAKTSTKLTVKGNYAGLFTRDITDQVTWSSETTNVAAFISTNRVKGFNAGTAILTATVGNISATYPITISPATISSIAVTPATPSIAKGFSQQFAATGTFSDATTQDITFDANWTSDASGFATVSDDTASKGLAKAIAIGSANIKAAFDVQSGTTLLTVTKEVLQSITVTPANSSVLNLPKTVTFTATGKYSDGSTADITSQATWASSQPAVATIIATSGVATTIALGTTSISATLNGVSGKTDLNVTNPLLSANGLKFDPVPPVPLIVGVGTSNTILTVTATFADGTTQDVTAISSWTSSDSTKATVSSGHVTGVAAGSAIITATYGGLPVSVTVTVQ